MVSMQGCNSEWLQTQGLMSIYNCLQLEYMGDQIFCQQKQWLVGANLKCVMVGLSKRYILA